MFPPFSESKAKKILAEIINLLNQKKLFLEQVTKPSEERKNSPVMIGALVCADNNGNEINLAANSGIAKQLKFSDKDDKNAFDDFDIIIVPPVVSAKQVEQALSKNDEEIHRLTEILKDKKNENEEIKARRAFLCNESLEKVESLYNFTCADGKIRSLKEMCLARNKGKFPPTGTGDCSAPKLLNYAFSHGLTPLSLAETEFGISGQLSAASEQENCRVKPGDSKTCVFNDGEIKLVPPCDARCKIILPEILGLEILYQDSSIVIVNKQSGLLSVPGRGEEKFDSVETRLRRLFPDCIKQPAVHRLDMETSGIIVLALTKEAHRKMNMAFESREVKKEYTALLDGVLAKKGIASEGEMELHFRLDVENRPHQIWDRENGKRAVTKWKILDVERYTSPDGSTRNATRVLFTPLTGRTHQLRLASADKHGFGVPIIGDTLYGHCGKGERLMLHASRIEFTHPETKEKMIFESEPGF